MGTGYSYGLAGQDRKVPLKKKRICKKKKERKNKREKPVMREAYGAIFSERLSRTDVGLLLFFL